MKKIILLSLSILLISSGFAFAEVPCKINYQGRLIKDNVPVDGTKTMNFSIYDSAVGPALLWTSGNVSVEVHNGLFRYVIGSDGEDLAGIFQTAGQTLYLEVIVDGQTLTPREELSAYPYAINSHLLEGETKEYFLNTSAETQTKLGDLNIGGNLSVGGFQFEHKGYDFVLGTDDGREKGHKESQRALVHGNNDRLLINYNTDFEGGVEIQPSVYISTTGNVGIGTTSPGGKLTVAGTIESTTGGVKFPDGTLQTTAVSSIQKYDSGWFLVSTGKNYTKTHNLGSQLLITQILFAPNSGGSPDLNHVTCIVGHNDANIDWRNINLNTGFIYDITPTTLKINTGREGVAVIPHDTYWVTKYTSGWYRILALRID